MAKLTSKDIADYFLVSVNEEVGDNLSNLKLQKLVYYAQGFHLALYNVPLFDESIQAWTYGPVVPALYHHYKAQGAGGICPPEEFDDSKYDKRTREVLNEVFKVYGQYSAWKLADMTHVEPPWTETPLGEAIPLSAMQEYFRTMLVNGEGE